MSRSQRKLSIHLKKNIRTYIYIYVYFFPGHLDNKTFIALLKNLSAELLHPNPPGQLVLTAELE